MRILARQESVGDFVQNLDPRYLLQLLNKISQFDHLLSGAIFAQVVAPLLGVNQTFQILG